MYAGWRLSTPSTSTYTAGAGRFPGRWRSMESVPKSIAAPPAEATTPVETYVRTGTVEHTLSYAMLIYV